MRGRGEDAIQRAVAQLLTHAARPGVSWFHVPNGGARSKAEAAIMKGLGVRAGVPDLIVFVAGACYGLELKAAGGRESPAQRAMAQELERAGVTCVVAYGLDEAMRWLGKWGAVRSTSFSG